MLVLEDASIHEPEETAIKEPEITAEQSQEALEKAWNANEKKKKKREVCNIFFVGKSLTNCIVNYEESNH
jgi:hypothetical protein